MTLVMTFVITRGNAEGGRSSGRICHKHPERRRKRGDQIKSIDFDVPGVPTGKARPRVVHHVGCRAEAYTPARTLVFENLCRFEFFQAAGEGYDKPSADLFFSGSVPLRIEITAYYIMPVSVSKRRRADMSNGKLRPMKKPDADNVAKSVLDALNGVAYKDDAQVVELLIRKEWAEINLTHVHIEALHH